MGQKCLKVKSRLFIRKVGETKCFLYNWMLQHETLETDSRGNSTKPRVDIRSSYIIFCLSAFYWMHIGRFQFLLLAVPCTCAWNVTLSISVGWFWFKYLNRGVKPCICIICRYDDHSHNRSTYLFIREAVISAVTQTNKIPKMLSETDAIEQEVGNGKPGKPNRAKSRTKNPRPLQVFYILFIFSLVWFNIF